MKKIISCVLVLALALVTLCSVAIAAPPTNWEAHKKVAAIYRLSLGGVTPTAAQIAANNLQIGDIIVDTSNGDVYFLTDATAGAAQFFKTTTSGIEVTGTIVASGAVTAAGVTNDAAAMTGNLPTATMTNALAAALTAVAPSLPAAQFTGNIVAARMTNALKQTFQTGTATSLQAITLSPVYSAAPKLLCTWAAVSTHRLPQVTANDGTNVVFTDNDAQSTAQFYWMAAP